LGAPYHDIFLCEVSKMTDVCDFNIGNDDDESLYGKAHHVTTCYPDIAGRTCNTDETMTSDYVYTVHYDYQQYPYNEHAFHTHYPAAFLANTVAVIQTALLQDPANFYDFWFPNQIELHPGSYNIGNSDSIVHYWLGMDSCDCGSAYDGVHYGWHNTRPYQGPPDYREGSCTHYYDYWVLRFLDGNHFWTTLGNNWMENDPTQDYSTSYPGNFYLPEFYPTFYTCARLDTGPEVDSTACAYNSCSFACNGTKIPDNC